MNNSRESSGQTDFDFDEWSQIAKTDPEKFEKMRRQLIESVFEQAPEHLRPQLERQQWQIDQVRNQSVTPLAACKKIFKKMWNSVHGDRGLLTALQSPQKLKQFTDGERNTEIINLQDFRSTKK